MGEALIINNSKWEHSSSRNVFHSTWKILGCKTIVLEANIQQELIYFS